MPTKAQNLGMNTHTVESDNPDLAGEVEFHIPLPMFRQINIERRMIELANHGRPESLEPITASDLGRTGRFYVEAVATLEHVIKKAPRGFYKNPDTKPELELLLFDSEEFRVLAAMYNQYLLCRDNFRRNRYKSTSETTEQPPSSDNSGSSTED